MEAFIKGIHAIKTKTMDKYYNRIAQCHNKKTIRIFIRFLKEEHVRYSYLKYIERQQSDETIFKMQIGCPSVFILNAFLWKKTKEGHAFWNNISESWYDFLCDNYDLV